MGLVLQGAAMTLSSGKRHAFLPVGDFTHFLAGGLMECACMYACEGQSWSCLGQAQVGAVAQGWWLTTAPGSHHVLLLPSSLLCVVPPLFGGKVSIPSSSFSSPVRPRLDAEISGP